MFKTISKHLILITVIAVTLSACVHQPLVKHDEVLVFNSAYDFTYASVLKAVQDAYPWELGITDKEHGTIVAYNQKYWDSLDADKRTVVLLIKRVERKKTTVELSPESQNVIGVGDILKSIDQVLAAYK